MKEILLFNYWEHIKAEKELARVFQPTNERRIEINKSANEILEKLNKEQESKRSVATKFNR